MSTEPTDVHSDDQDESSLVVKEARTLGEITMTLKMLDGIGPADPVVASILRETRRKLHDAYMLQHLAVSQALEGGT